MPFNYNDCDCSPLVVDKEYEISDEDLLAEYIGKIILGHFAHVKRIINALSSSVPSLTNDEIEMAIDKLRKKGKTDKEIEKRDGWIFQIISWLALYKENKGKIFYCQQPHDAPAQHGIDGIGIILSAKYTIENIIITEDKCTENGHRTLIPKIWKEFNEYEEGKHNNKIVSRITALLENLNDGEILEAIKNDISSKLLRKYRVGINRDQTYKTSKQRKKLFKGYSECVLGDNPHRRFAATIHQDNIRNWMEQLCNRIIKQLELQKV